MVFINSQEKSYQKDLRISLAQSEIGQLTTVDNLKVDKDTTEAVA